MSSPGWSECLPQTRETVRLGSALDTFAIRLSWHAALYELCWDVT
jgi:O-methyltransferase involved in polyketide biosynthesis